MRYLVILDNLILQSGLFTLSLFSLLTQVCPAQHTLKNAISLSLNNGLASVQPSDDAKNVKCLRALNFYLSAGLSRDIGHDHFFSLMLRYGTEKTRFEKEISKDNYVFYHMKNNSLALVLTPGIRADERQSFCITLGLAAIFESNIRGGGIMKNGYQYEYAVNKLPTTIDFRPGIKYRYRLHSKKPYWLEGGIEPSLIRRNVGLKKNTSSNFTESYYEISYDLVMIYASLSLN